MYLSLNNVIYFMGFEICTVIFAINTIICWVFVGEIDITSVFMRGARSSFTMHSQH